MKNFIAKKIYLKSTTERVRKKLELLDLKLNPYLFLNLRLLITIIFLIIIYFLTKSIILAILFIIPFYILIEYFFFDRKIKQKNNSLEYELIFFLDIFDLVYSTNHNLKESLIIAIQHSNLKISSYFKKVIDDMNKGKTFDVAISNMSNKINSSSIKNILLNFKESYLHGNILNLKKEEEYLRTVNIINLKYQTSHLPLSVLAISLLLMTPLVLLVIFAPVVLDLIIAL